MTLSSVFVILPLLACLFWFLRFAVHHRRSDAAKRTLTVFFGICTVLYLCHAIFFFLYSETGLPTPIEGLWATCSLSVYPLYFLYICRLTAQTVSPRKLTIIFAPGLLVAIAVFVWNNEATDTIRQAVTALQVLSVVVFGSLRLRTFDRNITELYAETEDKNVHPVRILLLAVMLISLISFVLNILGREYFIATQWTIVIALGLMTALLFMLGEIGYKRSFRVDQFLADNPEETVSDVSAEPGELGAKIERLMITEAYYLHKNVTLTDVAREVGSCRTYVSNYINQQMHCSFSDYVNRLRVEHAKMVIMQHERHGGESKFSVIALSVGFTNEQSFYRNFRKHAGMTPNAWLEQQRRTHSPHHDSVKGV